MKKPFGVVIKTEHINTTYIDDMKLTLLSQEFTQGENENKNKNEVEVIELIAIFINIKQRVLKESKNRHRCIPIIRL